MISRKCCSVLFSCFSYFTPNKYLKSETKPNFNFLSLMNKIELNVI
jgi:hypothetical protein